MDLFQVQGLMNVQVRTLSLGERMKMELIVAPPTAISVTNAMTRFISGKVMARPAIAIGPTP